MDDRERIRQLRREGRRREALELADACIESETDPVRLMGLYATRGYLRRAMDRIEEAEEDFRAGIDLFDGESGIRYAVLCRRGLALCQRTKPNLGAAMAEHRRELELAERLGDPRILCGTHANVAGLLITQGRYDRAEEHARRQLSHAAGLQDSGLLRIALSNLGRALMFRGLVHQARWCFGEQLAIAEEAEDTSGVSMALNNLSILELEHGTTESALEHLQRQLELGRETGRRSTEMHALGNMSIAYRRLGRHRMALDYSRELFRMAWERSDWLKMTAALSNMAEAYIHLGEPDRAGQCLQKLVRNAETGALRDKLARGLRLLSSLKLAGGAREEAYLHAERACRLFRAQSAQEEELTACAAALEALPAGDPRAAVMLERAGEIGGSDGEVGERMAAAAARHSGGPVPAEPPKGTESLLGRARWMQAAGDGGRAAAVLEESAEAAPLTTLETLLLLELRGEG